MLRASYGKYNEQPSSAYEQYNGLEQNLPDTLTQFYSLGFTTPGHAVAPSISFNSDFSIEHHFKGTDMSFKLTPFLRQTQAQVENFYINYATGSTSGLNAGNQTSSGFEFEFNKGDFNRNGLSGQLSFAYTYATVKYSLLPNATTILSPINAGISQYNAYTKACAPGGAQYGKQQFGQAVCGYTTAGPGSYAAPCYTPGGIADPSCKRPHDIANPYWLSPAYSLYDPAASYLPYSTFPGSGRLRRERLQLSVRRDAGPELQARPAFNHAVAAVHGRQSVRRAADDAGHRSGVDVRVAAAGNDDRRSALSVRRGRRPPYNANHGHCLADLSIPDPYTGQFDAIGAFREPAQLLGHLRIGYELSPRATVTVTLANLLQTCFGGQSTALPIFKSNQRLLVRQPRRRTEHAAGRQRV